MSLIFVIDRWVADDEIKEFVMGAACSTCGGRREMRARFWWESLNDRDYLEDLSIDGWIMLKWVLKRAQRNIVGGFFWQGVGTGGALL